TFSHDLERAIVAFGGDDHEPSDDLLRLDEGPVRHAGRGQDLAAGLELAAHVQNIRLALLLPDIERGVHFLHLRRGRLLLLLLLPGRAPVDAQVLLSWHHRLLSSLGRSPGRHPKDARRLASWTLRRDFPPP